MIKHDKYIIMNCAEFYAWIKQLKVKRKINHVQIHCTASPDYGDFKDLNYVDLLERMEKAHLKRGFSQIAQNITIFPNGYIAICRPFDVMPAGIEGHNTGGICIENVGLFDKGHDEMAPVQRASILACVAALCLKFKLQPSTDSIVYHAWFAKKTCPGTNFFGGNTVEACKKYFIPEVQKVYKVLAPKIL